MYVARTEAATAPVERRPSAGSDAEQYPLELLQSQRSSYPRENMTSGEATNGEERIGRGWKYVGYPEFSKWMASANDFFVLRRFDTLNARVLLRLQDQIAELGDNLEDIDRTCMRTADDTIYSRVDSLRLDREIQPAREELLERLTTKLERYSQ